MEFIENFENSVKAYVIVGSSICIGKGKKYVFNLQEKNACWENDENCKNYEKLIHKKRRYTTMKYCENLKINDSMIELDNGMKGVITNICTIGDNEAGIILFYHPIYIKSNIPNMPEVSHIRECHIDYDRVYSCKPTNLKNQCILVKIKSKLYVTSILRGSLGD